MQELRLYDPDRTPKSWTDIIRPGQYAVFHSGLHSDVAKAADGRFLEHGDYGSCLLFDSLAEAEDYCEAKVEEIPSLRCDIFDHLGKGKPPLLTYVNQAQVHAPKKNALGLVADCRQPALLLAGLALELCPHLAHHRWAQSGVRGVTLDLLGLGRRGEAAVAACSLDPRRVRASSEIPCVARDPYRYNYS